MSEKSINAYYIYVHPQLNFSEVLFIFYSFVIHNLLLILPPVLPANFSLFHFEPCYAIFKFYFTFHVNYILKMQHLNLKEREVIFHCMEIQVAPVSTIHILKLMEGMPIKQFQKNPAHTPLAHKQQ